VLIACAIGHETLAMGGRYGGPALTEIPSIN
jgi:hypothetical protein